MTRNPVTNTFSHLARQLRSRVGQHDDELVATVTSHGIGVSNGGKDHRRHLHQHVRADEVTVFIVDLFEVIEIEKQSRDTRSVTSRTPDLVQEKLSQVSRVVKLREVVSLRKPLGLRDAN